MNKILVIEDDEPLRDTIGLLLERENLTPILAADAETGLEMALTLKPQLLLVDLRWPRMSGLDLCKELRALRMQTPIIILSAIGDELNKVLLLELGADDYVLAMLVGGHAANLRPIDCAVSGNVVHAELNDATGGVIARGETWVSTQDNVT
jgi:CheY-like chemotaxis protein